MIKGGYKIFDRGGMYYVSFAVLAWVDVFTRKAYDGCKKIYPFNFRIGFPLSLHPVIYHSDLNKKIVSCVTNQGNGSYVLYKSLAQFKAKCSDIFYTNGCLLLYLLF